VEAASDASRRLTGTVLRRDPAALNGRRRGTKDFLGRGAQSSQSNGTRLKFHSTDPVDVLGAASRGHHFARQSFDADQNVRRVHPSAKHEKEGIILQDSAVRLLTSEALARRSRNHWTR
jgi:hypothetical protein